VTIVLGRLFLILGFHLSSRVVAYQLEYEVGCWIQ